MRKVKAGLFLVWLILSSRAGWWWTSSSTTSSPFFLLVEARANGWGWRRWFGPRPQQMPMEMKQRRKWSSMFTVDPSSILTTLLKAGGIFIPKSSQKDINVLRACMHCERAEMNVVEKTMILYNSTIGLQGQPPALLVGRTYVHWDSYTRPTIYIEVDDVALLVEFHNILLTKSNWQCLKEEGFPPEIAVSPSDTTPADKPLKAPSKNEAQATDLVRVGSIDLSGVAIIRIVSTALGKELGTMELDMDSFDDFTALMKEASEQHFHETGRRGLTSTELATMLQSYFTKKIRSYLLENFGDVATDTKGALEDARGLVHRAANSVLEYAMDASRKTGDDLQEVVATRFGVSRSKLNRLRDSLQNLNRTAVRDALARHQEFFTNRTSLTGLTNIDEPQHPGN